MVASLLYATPPAQQPVVLAAYRAFIDFLPAPP